MWLEFRNFFFDIFCRTLLSRFFFFEDQTRYPAGRTSDGSQNFLGVSAISDHFTQLPIQLFWVFFFLCLTDFQQNTKFFLRYPPFQFNFAQFPFWLLSILLLILYELPTEHQIFLGCLPFQITLNSSHFNPWVFFLLYLTDFRQNTKFSWSIRPFR